MTLELENGSSISVTGAVGPPTIVNNGDGTVTVVGTDGTKTVIEDVTGLIDNGDGTMTLELENGSSISVTGVAAPPTIVNNGDGTVTIVGTDGTKKVIEDVKGLIDNENG